MTIKEFIEAAIEGGWESKQVWWRQDTGEIVLNLFGRSDLALMLLDPKAWEAVGRIKKWNIFIPPKENLPGFYQQHYSIYMHKMIDALIKGKTLEEYIATLH